MAEQAVRMLFGVCGVRLHNSEPTDVMIAEGLAAYQKNGCDCLIGIGGGSPLDAMKAHCRRHDSSAPLASYMGKGDQRSTPVYGGDPHHSRNRF